eukprot:CAMPEP_0171130668 /NCGR_PEP_ID=MMETSP0766_2-20121228/121312_1 /TAXON_ID=439317 /ORGANISM="Gambierdiscus australes, Strain CAWD 149" /LENGTH=57 /DNA_ID=CAMNT_0011593925 /DNA_START=255 /DNA_END=424 /DNA_ORIENTATION=-
MASLTACAEALALPLGAWHKTKDVPAPCIDVPGGLASISGMQCRYGQPEADFFTGSG